MRPPPTPGDPRLRSGPGPLPPPAERASGVSPSALRVCIPELRSGVCSAAGGSVSHNPALENWSREGEANGKFRAGSRPTLASGQVAG